MLPHRTGQRKINAMWREFLWKMGRPKRASASAPIMDSDGESCDSDSSGISGHYSFQHTLPRTDNASDVTGSDATLKTSARRVPNQRYVLKEETTAQFATTTTTNTPNVADRDDDADDDADVCWQEKFDYMLSLIREPRYLLAETLVAEQLKLTLKQQAYKLEQLLLHQTIKEVESPIEPSNQSTSSTSSRNGSSATDTTADLESLQKQLRLVDRRLATLTGRLEVLKAVQQVLPPAPPRGEIASAGHAADNAEPDSLENLLRTSAHGQQSAPVNRGVGSSSVGACGTTRASPNGASVTDVPSHADLLALLQLERLAQQATRRDYELLRKQYERLKEELEWRDSGHGDDLGDAELSSELISDRDRDSDSVHMRPTVALKSWSWRSTTPSRQSAVTTVRRRRHHQHRSDNASTCSSLDSLPDTKHLWSELEARDRTIADLRLVIARLEPETDAARHQVAQLDMINKDLERKNQELQIIIDNLNANIEALKAYQLLEQQDNRSGFVSADENIQRKRTYKVNENKEFVQMRALIGELQEKEADYKARIEELELALRNSNNSLPELPNLEELERHVSHVEKELEERDDQVTALQNYLVAREEELAAMKLDLDPLREENERLKREIDGVIQRDRESSQERVDQVSRELHHALEANKRLLEDINRERVLRKKYFNTIEDLKGKIRVYCRLKPLTSTEERTNQCIADVLDPYTVVINGPKGAREFHFDRVFNAHESQETIFEDTHTLVQSAFDGYNVCICAYGQTGSGKTHTIIGDGDQPGLAPRTFERIFQLADEHRAQFDVQVSCSMLELYNDRLIDLLRGDQAEVKLEIKKDKRGIVWVQGARVCGVTSASQLNDMFHHGLQTRHTGSTRMNDRSSRSHLIVSIGIDCTSRLHGTVIRGKVSLLDLAGSERFAKSGASSEQLREASSINKSLSTLGDVISALASEQQHTPYRNSKLTMLMQDSLGGNAKTLLFVTASVAAYNLDETLTSLTYASRAKAVTNAAQRNTECKEIVRLKAIINKLRRGDADVDDTS